MFMTIKMFRDRIFLNDFFGFYSKLNRCRWKFVWFTLKHCYFRLHIHNQRRWTTSNLGSIFVLEYCIDVFISISGSDVAFASSWATKSRTECDRKFYAFAVIFNIFLPALRAISTDLTHNRPRWFPYSDLWLHESFHHSLSTLFHLDAVSCNRFCASSRANNRARTRKRTANFPIFRL